MKSPPVTEIEPLGASAAMIAPELSIFKNLFVSVNPAIFDNLLLAFCFPVAYPS